MKELTPAVRLGAFGAGLAVVLVAALGVGRATGDVAQAQDAPAPTAEHGSGGHGAGHGADGDGSGGHGAGHGARGDGSGGHGAGPAPAAAGTSLSADGLRLEVSQTTLPPLQATRFSFRVLGEDGEPLTEYDLEQGKRMHLVIVSRDLSRHAHVHPELAADGTWSTLLTLSPGTYRAVADFSTGGERRSLGVDLAAPGQLAIAPLPAAATTATVDDLRVELDRDGERLSFTAYDPSGTAVVPEPYLGARGHLVAFRAGDLAYAHVHPAGEDGATTSYDAELPGPGTYRLFLEISVAGDVRTFPFTLEVAA